MGDFNLDAEMEHRQDYLYKIPFGYLTDFTTHNNLVQLINFKTWTRTINGVKKESTLDHIYTDNDTLVDFVNFKVPTFGDHNLIIAKLTVKLTKNSVSICKRNWLYYSKNFLIDNIDVTNLLPNGDVQAQWNALEHSLIMAADIVAPIIVINKNPKTKNTDAPPNVKRMFNRRKNLLRIERCKTRKRA